jgi:non-ribosomal peptide synthetase component F
MAFMLGDAGAAVLLTEDGLRSSLPESKSYLVSLDGEWEEITQCSNASPKTAAQPYVIYTSGSTGKPKGVMVSHQNLINYVYAISQQLEMSGNDRVLQFASISFDVAVEEIFPTLATGGVVVIDRSGVETSFAELEKILRNEQISWIELPTAYWQTWVSDLESRGGEISGSVRQVIGYRWGREDVSKECTWMGADRRADAACIWADRDNDYDESLPSGRREG